MSRSDKPTKTKNTDAGLKHLNIDSEHFSKPVSKPQIYKPPSKLRELQWFTQDAVVDLKSRFQRMVQYEFESGTGFNLMPVFFGIGISAYFIAPVEPSVVALIIPLVAIIYIVLKLQLENTAYLTAIAVAACFSGMLAASVATGRADAPMIERQITTQISGVVLSVDQNRRGSPRYIVQPTWVEKLSNEEMPKKVRLSAASKHDRIYPGGTIEGLARLQPISGPIRPNGYDFSFFSWFKELGGSGFFMGKPQQGDHVALSWSVASITAINRFRARIEERISNVLPGMSGAVAVALVTGNKTGIPDEVQNSLRVTGLAHILAISGLHMALVTLTVIWGVRAVLARIPKIALNYPTKKIAAAIGFFSATFYLFVSGGGIATQRAWIMISVMLLAALMDRKAITMRSVAVSAMIILILNPQTLFSPGFQMSFAAVASLVAGYEVLNKRRRLQSENALIVSPPNWIFQKIKIVFTYFLGIAVTSLIAGSATGFVAAWHFNQFAPYGLIANILAMPFVTILVMPFVLVSVLLMPYGFEGVALAPVAFGIEQVVSISQSVESYAPDNATGNLPPISIALFGLLLAILTILKTKLRLVSLGVVPIMFFAWKPSPVPDLIIAENGRAMAVKTSAGKLSLLNTRSGSFVTEIWRKAWVSGSFERIKIPKEQCNKERCVYVLPDSSTLHVVYDPDLLQSSCQRADILIAPRLWWVNCKQRKPDIILKRYDFERYGMHSFYKNDIDHLSPTGGARPSYIIKTGLKNNARPWTRKVSPVE